MNSSSLDRISQFVSSSSTQKDSLTGLANGAYFINRLTQTVSNSSRSLKPSSLLLVDVEKLQDPQTKLGLLDMTPLIKIVAARLSDCVRTSDTIARLGDTLFAIILDTPVTTRVAMRMALRIQESFDEPVVLGESTVSPAVFVGIAMAPQDGTTAETLIANAATALDVSIAAGSSDFIFFEHELNKKVKTRITKSVQIKQAIEDKQFKINLLEIKNSSDEAESVLVAPDVLVDDQETQEILADTGKLDEYWKLVLKEAVRILSQGKHVVVVAPQGIVWKQQFVAELVKAKTSGFEKGTLEVWIREDVVLENVEKISDIAYLLKQQGVLMGICDFGSTVGSLKLIKRLLPSRVVITKDYSFYQGSKKDSAYLRSLAEGISSLGATPTAWSKTNENKQVLTNLGFINLISLG